MSLNILIHTLYSAHWRCWPGGGLQVVAEVNLHLGNRSSGGGWECSVVSSQHGSVVRCSHRREAINIGKDIIIYR